MFVLMMMALMMVALMMVALMMVALMMKIIIITITMTINSMATIQLLRKNTRIKITLSVIIATIIKECDVQNAHSNDDI